MNRWKILSLSNPKKVDYTPERQFTFDNLSMDSKANVKWFYIALAPNEMC